MGAVAGLGKKRGKEKWGGGVSAEGLAGGSLSRCHCSCAVCTTNSCDAACNMFVAINVALTHAEQVSVYP